MGPLHGFLAPGETAIMWYDVVVLDVLTKSTRGTEMIGAMRNDWERSPRFTKSRGMIIKMIWGRVFTPEGTFVI